MTAEVRPGVYCIRIKEQIDSQWKDWLGDFQIEYTPAGETLICGLFIDQAALHGLLDWIRDFNLTLISITPVESQ